MTARTLPAMEVPRCPGALLVLLAAVLAHCAAALALEDSDMAPTPSGEFKQIQVAKMKI